MYTKDANKHLCQSSSYKRHHIHMLYIDVSSVVANDTKVLLPRCDLGHNIGIALKKMQCSAGYIMHMHYANDAMCSQSKLTWITETISEGLN